MEVEVQGIGRKIFTENRGKVKQSKILDDVANPFTLRKLDANGLVSINYLTEPFFFSVVIDKVNYTGFGVNTFGVINLPRTKVTPFRYSLPPSLLVPFLCFSFTVCLWFSGWLSLSMGELSYKQIESLNEYHLQVIYRQLTYLLTIRSWSLW